MIAILASGMTSLVLVAVMAANSIVTGAIDLIAAVRLSKRTRKVGRRGGNEWLIFVIGLLSVLFGAVVLAYLDAGALALVWMIGGYVVLTGALLVALGISARAWQRSDFPDKRNRPFHP
jgi:uncharacterized membrane protein HdeD (DUF308 family)